MANEDTPTVYAVRLTNRARADVEYHHDRLLTFSGQKVASEWEDGLYEALSHLATGPLRPLAMEAALLGHEVRSLPYRRPGSQAAHRILYVIREETPDGPMVVVFHIRHASAGPLQSYEVRDLASDLEEFGQ